MTNCCQKGLHLWFTAAPRTMGGRLTCKQKLYPVSFIEKPREMMMSGFCVGYFTHPP